MSYEEHAAWETLLFEALHREAPPGFARPSLAQLLQCDKAAFGRLTSPLTSVRQRDDGTYPLGQALLALRRDPLIALYLMPSSRSSPTPPVAAPMSGSSSSARPHPYNQPSSKGKGNGKRGGGKSSPPVPAELRGKWHKSSNGEPICYGYKLSKWLQ